MTVSLSHLTTDTSIDPIAIRAVSVKAAKPDQPAIMRSRETGGSRPVDMTSARPLK